MSESGAKTSSESSEDLYGIMAEVVRRKKERDAGRRELGIDKPKRCRGTYDLPEYLKLAIAVIADREGFSHSSVAALLLAAGAHQYAIGHVSFEGTKARVEHKAYDYTVDEETILQILHGEPLETQVHAPFVFTVPMDSRVLSGSDLDEC